jgi:hypothetical protein
MQMQMQRQPQDGGSGGREGRMMMGRDPSQMFDMMAQGGNVINRPSDPMQARMFDRFAQMTGSTNGQITREQFQAAVGAMQAQFGGMQQQFGGGQGGGFGSQGRFPGGQGGPGGFSGGGFNIQGGGRGGRDFSSFMPGGFPGMQRGGRDGNQRRGDSSGTTTPQPPEHPTVLKAGNLPSSLAWFEQLDQDYDGQVGLYEWVKASRSPSEFKQWDRNDDGLLTPEEALEYSRYANSTPGTVLVFADDPAANSAGGGFSGGRGMMGNGGDRRFNFGPDGGNMPGFGPGGGPRGRDWMGNAGGDNMMFRGPGGASFDVTNGPGRRPRPGFDGNDNGGSERFSGPGRGRGRGRGGDNGSERGPGRGRGRFGG